MKTLKNNILYGEIYKKFKTPTKFTFCEATENGSFDQICNLFLEEKYMFIML